MDWKISLRNFFPFKINSTPSRKGMVWKKLYHYFALHNDEFLEKYHTRSNAEATVFMIMSMFGDCVRSKKWTAQVNEVLCKIISHNICCVIMEMFCLGIKPEFFLMRGLVPTENEKFTTK